MKKTNSAEEFIAASKGFGTELAALREILLSMDLTEETKWGMPCYTARDMPRGKAKTL